MIRRRIYDRRARAFRDERGSLTIEFLLWLPILAFWLVVSLAFFQAYTSRNDASNAAHALSDIMSRQTEVTDGFIAELYNLQNRLLPNAPQGTQLRVSSIEYDGDEQVHRVLWSSAIGVEPFPSTEISVSVLPAMADNDTVILTELNVPFQPFSTWARIGSRTWRFAKVVRPRFVPAVAMLE